MRRRAALVLFVAFSFSVALMYAGEVQSAPAPGITPRVLLQTTTTITGQPLQFSLFRNQVVAVLAELDPGGQTSPQRFFVPVVLYVLEGTLTVEIEGQTPRTITAGQALVPPINASTNGANRGTTAVRWLFVAFADASKPVATPAAAPVGFRRTVVLRTTKTFMGEDIVFPLLANQLTVLAVDFAPGAVNPRHIHPHTQFIYVLDGNTTVEPDNVPARTFAPGQAFVETTRPHVGANRGTTRGTVFTIFAGEAGTPTTAPMPGP